VATLSFKVNKVISNLNIIIADSNSDGSTDYVRVVLYCISQ
jgi:hypothetical protein